MSATSGYLICRNTSKRLLYKESTGHLLYGVSYREVEGALASGATSIGGSMATHYMPIDADDYDAVRWIRANASSSTVRWGTLPGGTTVRGISWFYWGRSQQKDPDDPRIWLNGVDGCYGIVARRCRLTVANPIEITRVRVTASFNGHSPIPIDVAFYFSDSTTQPLSADDILDLPAYRADPPNSIDVHLQVPQGATALWTYVYAHDWAMGDPTSTGATTTPKGVTNASVGNLWYNVT